MSRKGTTHLVRPADRAAELTDRGGVAFPVAWDPFVRTKADLEAIRQGCFFDLPAAEKVRTFFRTCLKHTKGEWAGKPFDLQGWQWFDIVAPLYGWKFPDGLRRYRKAYVEIPKKNGKSALASGLSIFALLEEPGAEVYPCAFSKDQAAIVYDEAVNMVEGSPALQAWLEPLPGYREIRCDRRNAWIAVIASDGATSQGKNASFTVADELHAWTGSKGRDFYESMLYAGRARRQPILFQITTAGDDTTSICYEQRTRAERILAGDELSIEFLPVIYAADPDGDWRDIEQWKKANPSFGVTMDERSIRADIAEAEGQPNLIASLKRYGLNQWIGSSVGWLDVPTFRKRLVSPETITLEAIAKANKRAGGIDLASERDFAALCFAGEFDQDRTLFWIRLYIPGDDLALRGKTLGIPLEAWVDAGWIVATDGDRIDYDVIKADTLSAAEIVNPSQIGFDRWNAERLCNQELRIGCGLPMIEVPQTFPGMAIATREFEQRILAGKAEFANNPAIAWMAANARVQTDQCGNIIPRKGKSRGKIDGIVSAIVALSRLLDATEAPGKFYETNEVEFL